MDSGGGRGGGVEDAEDRSEVEMGMGTESFSSTAYSGTCDRHGQWKDSKNSNEFLILGYFPNNYNYY